MVPTKIQSKTPDALASLRSPLAAAVAPVRSLSPLIFPATAGGAAASLMGKAKRGSIFIRLVSAAGTGFFYVKRKNPAKMTEKLEFRKYDPRVNKHVLFTEAKMK
ncbi:hypothetical protein BHE74_00046138 [Ensete ventricosum]|nr:hypothetical protein BHE74_00046138 [Ensete ventricosum]RZS11901.1 hypothetical protein BHM03_00043270 [Ensete ventricosum]